jgi:alanyl-tRNA synthetase
MARENGLDVDMEKFEERMAEQRSRSRADRYEPDTAAWIPPDAKSLVVFNSEMARQLDAGVSEDEVKFVGYEQLEAHGAVLYCKANALVLDTTPFYAEAGGQVGDLGVIEFDGRQLKVVDTQRGKNGNVHLLEAVVDIPPHVEVILRVNAQRRHEIMRNHSATHLVHEALRQVLGDHLHQQGSLVAADYLRFDFNHFERVSQDELRAIEDIVNEKISDAIPVAVSNDPKDWLAIEEAKRRYPNIKMFFGDKYGDRVRIVEIDPKFSVELCGGTHVGNTRDIGPFKIVSEASVASGIRRIVAVTGDGLRRYVDEKLHRIGDLDEQLAALIEEKATLEKQLGIVPQVEEPKRERLIVPARSENLNRAVVDDIEAVERARESTIEEIAKAANDLKKELSKRRVHDASGSMEQLVSSAFPFDGFKIVSSRVEAHSIDELKSMGDALRAKLGSGVGVLGAIVDEKAAFVCVVTDDLMKSKNLHAGKIVGKLAKRVGGGGGGRPHLATAGGKEVAKLDDALNQTKQIIESLLLR